jgi:hypothetical protein
MCYPVISGCDTKKGFSGPKKGSKGLDVCIPKARHSKYGNCKEIQKCSLNRLKQMLTNTHTQVL